MKCKSRISTAIRSLDDLDQKDVVAIELVAQAVRRALKVLGAKTTFYMLQNQMHVGGKPQVTQLPNVHSFFPNMRGRGWCRAWQRAEFPYPDVDTAAPFATLPEGATS